MSCRLIAQHRRGPLGIPNGQKAWCRMFLQVAASYLQASNGLQDEKMSRMELTDVLEEAVVQREGHLVTLNKPQGLAVIGKPGDVTVHSVLPELSQRLGFDQPLEVVKSAEKESSGLVLLSGCPKTSENLRNYFIWSHRAKRPAVTYRAITVGIPNPFEGEVKTALKLEQKWGEKWLLPVKDSFRRKQDDTKTTMSWYRVLDSKWDCALVQLQPLSAFSGQLLVHMMLKLCPVLGDHKYSAFVGTALGQRFLLSPDTMPQKQHQVLDERLLHRLHLTQQQMSLVPIHLHLHQLLLPKKGLKPGHNVLTAPPPPFFVQTLERLQLRF
ncbi:mitochondrial mRNA pseudouridine synthase RPUSD3 isoform X1 [Ornithorhynchus anatinus]|uniref:RNA pseudouridine synthase D3 n=1 Tax=Ornithorhynchus anatinus TaxID=9258 RepID=F7FQ24_ORNAN|nr:mitochondrial mRNA pseudouridine synthase RPUSD3 isoform X1 [Ornithorhynchus anatinus]